MSSAFDPQLLSYDASRSSGMNVGWNAQGQPDQLAAFGQTVKYQWYAGKIEGKPPEARLTLQSNLVRSTCSRLTRCIRTSTAFSAAMIIEPAGSTWQCGDTEVLRVVTRPPPSGQHSRFGHRHVAG